MTTPPVRIVHYTKVFNSIWNNGEERRISCSKPDNLYQEYDEDAWCLVTPDTTNIKDASALVYHAHDTKLSKLPYRERQALQPWILYTMESPFNPPYRHQPDKMEVFNYLGSYHLKSRFLFSYFSPNIMNIIRQPLDADLLQQKRKTAPILWIASNCQAWNNRHLYIQELMKYINVDSYGHCLNNQPSPSNEQERSDLMKQYKFYLAVENSNCDDYVTEKLFDTFMSSTVPIVDGPMYYEPHLPNNRSVIRMDAYPDPRKLADYIDYLDKNDTAYLEYLSFRDHKHPEEQRLDTGFYAAWGNRTSFDMVAAWCGVCQGVSAWQQAKLHKSDFVSDQTQFLLADTSCRPAGKWDYAAYGPPYIPNWRPSLPDEFTRPGHPNHRQLAPYDLRILRNDGLDDASRWAWMGFTSYCMLFIVFMIFLLYRKKQA